MQRNGNYRSNILLVLISGICNKIYFCLCTFLCHPRDSIRKDNNYPDNPRINNIHIKDREASAKKYIKERFGDRSMDLHGKVGFRLRKIENNILCIGQEFLGGYLDWIGLDYDINPKKNIFEYEIEILGV